MPDLTELSGLCGVKRFLSTKTRPEAAMLPDTGGWVKRMLSVCVCIHTGRCPVCLSLQAAQSFRL